LTRLAQDFAMVWQNGPNYMLAKTCAAVSQC